MFSAKRVIEVIIKGTDSSGPAFVNLKDRIKGLIKSKAFLATAAVAAGAAIVAMAAKSVAAYNRMIDKAGKLQKSVLEVTTLTDENARSARELSSDLQDLAVKFGQVDEVMAKAQYNIVSAGFGGIADSMMIMDVANRAAIAGLTDINTSVKVVTQTLNAYGKGADDAEEVAGILFATIKGGVTTFEELSTSLGKVTGTAAAAKIPFEEVGAAMAVLTKNGQNSAEAANALNALILAIGASSGESKDLLDELNISLDDGLGPALVAVADASGGALDKLVELVPNVRAVRAAASAAANDGENFAEQLDAMANGAEDFNKAYGIMSKSYQQSADRNTAASAKFSNAVGSTGLEGKQEILDAWTESLVFMADIVEENSEELTIFATNVGKLTGAIVELTAGAVSLVYWIGGQLSEALAMSDLLVKESSKGVEEYAQKLHDAAVEAGDLQERLDSIEPPLFTAEDFGIPGLELPSDKLQAGVDEEQRILKEARDQEKADAEAAAVFVAESVRANMVAEAEAMGVDLFKTIFNPQGGTWVQIAKSAEEVAAELTARLNEELGRTILSAPKIEKETEAAEDPDFSQDIIEDLEVENELIQQATDSLTAQLDEWQKIEDASMAAAEAAGRVGHETVQAFLRGENTMKAFGNAIKNEVINAISAAIAKMIVLRSLMFFTGVFSDIAGGVKDGGTVGMASGGAARLVAGGQPGMDSVPALLMPGETVITRNDTQRLNNFLASFESSSMVDPATLSGGSSGAVSVSMNIARPVGYLDMLDLGDAAVVASQKLAEANL